MISRVSFKNVLRKLVKGRSLVVGDTETEAAQLIKSMLGLSAVSRDFHLGELLEIEHQGIAPPDGILGLTYQLFVDLAVTVRVNIFLYTLPRVNKAAGLVDTVLVSVAEFVPKRTTALHLMVPWQMVEPKDQILGTGFHIVI